MPLKLALCVIGPLLIVLLSFVALVLPLPSTDVISFENRLRPPDLTYPLGTDELGRDLLSWYITGAGLTISTAGLSTMIAVALGWPLGRLALTAPMWIGRLVVLLAYIGYIAPRLVFSCSWQGRILVAFLCLTCVFPVLWLSTAPLATGILGGWESSLALGPAFAISVAYVVCRYGQLRHCEATCCSGDTLLSPGALIPAIFAWSMCAQIIFDYLGIVTSPPTPTWGGMIYEGQKNISSGSGFLWSGISICLSVFALIISSFAISDLIARRGKHMQN